MSIQPKSQPFKFEIRKRPCTWITIPLVSGILVAEYSIKPTPLATATLLSVIFLVITRFPQRFILSGLLIMLLGWANHQWHTRILSKDDLRLLIGNQPRIATIDGIICSTPTSRATQTDKGIRFHSQFILETKRINFSQAWRPAEGLLLVRVNQALDPELHQGSLINVAGCIRHPQTPMVPGAFNARKHLRYQGIHYEIPLNDWSKVLKAQDRPPPSRCLPNSKSGLVKRSPLANPRTIKRRSLSGQWS